MSSRIWHSTVPLLTQSHRVVVPTALGHRGGPEPRQRPVTFRDLVDCAEAEIDRLGEPKVHLAGNSLGGWMALELARRGRALTVCALSPAGFWLPGEPSQTTATNGIRKSWALAHASRKLTSILLRSSRLRAHSFAGIAHGGVLSHEEAVTIARDLLECTVTEDMLSTTDRFDPWHDLSCPVTIAWSKEDLVFPQAVNEPIARERVPEARFETLDGVGHVPMLDDPDLVADTILRATGAIQ
ncbi:hypothetical protein CH254_24110 [Rhodococcus sp. 06-412-2C]|nr:hypothetical protein CH254_24110 [Rhodococcus sp. 06-412-2C]OZC94440.1 hypothetical protein CH279_22195 [Rhodococcus sp. 06-412-2B]